jgi:hypothetical protein
LLNISFLLALCFLWRFLYGEGVRQLLELLDGAINLPPRLLALPLVHVHGCRPPPLRGARCNRHYHVEIAH